MGSAASSSTPYALKQSVKQAKQGDKVPNLVFKVRVAAPKENNANCFEWKDIKSADLFKGKRVVVFAVPGGMSNIIERK